MNLTEWARVHDRYPKTAYRWFRQGTLPVPAVRVEPRTILVNAHASAAAQPGRVGLYVRVSPHDQRGNLEPRFARLNRSRQSAGMPVVRMETEVGSGMNGAQSKVRRPLADPKVTMVVVEHRDRLARMNAELVEAALSAHGRRLVVADDGEVTDDSVRDTVEVLTSFYARLYGQRPARNRTLKALRCARPNVGVSGR